MEINPTAHFEQFTLNGRSAEIQMVTTENPSVRRLFQPSVTMGTNSRVSLFLELKQRISRSCKQNWTRLDMKLVLLADCMQGRDVTIHPTG